MPTRHRNPFVGHLRLAIEVYHERDEMRTAAEEEMALNQGDRDWVKLIISESLTQHSRRPLERFKSWSPLGAMVAVGLFVLIQWNGYTVFRTQTEGRLGTIETSLLAMRASRTAINPDSEKSQVDAKEVLALARQKEISLPLNVVQETGKRFIDVADVSPKAWDVALDFISYRSSLNAASRPDPFAVIKVRDQSATHYELGARIPDKNPPMMQWIQPLVPADMATRYNPIGHDQNTGVKTQPSGLFLEGGATTLDGEELRNIIFDRVEIHYYGAPVILENVTFINCTFFIDNGPAQRRLGEEMLAASKINFRNAG